MKQVLSNLSVLATNLHVSLPIILTLGLSLAEIWLPDKYQNNIHKTERALISYGVLAAANSAPAQKDQKDQNK